MSCVDENIKRLFFKARLFAEDALEQGYFSIQTQKELAAFLLHHVKRGDPAAEQVMELVCLHKDNKDFKAETISPDEKALFQKVLTMWENHELEI